MEELLIEAVGETVGTSPKKWALTVLALVAAGIGALRLTRRGRQATAELVPAAVVA